MDSPWPEDDTLGAGCLVLFGFVVLAVVFLVRGILPEGGPSEPPDDVERRYMI